MSLASVILSAFKSKKTEEARNLERSLTRFANADGHKVRVRVQENDSKYHVIYARCTDAELIDRTARLGKRNYQGDLNGLLESLEDHQYRMEFDIQKKTVPIQTDQYIRMTLKSPYVKNFKYAPEEISMVLGQINPDDNLSVLETRAGFDKLNLIMVYKSDSTNLDDAFMKRMYDALESIYKMASMPGSTEAVLDEVVPDVQKIARSSCFSIF